MGEQYKLKPVDTPFCTPNLTFYNSKEKKGGKNQEAGKFIIKTGKRQNYNKIRLCELSGLQISWNFDLRAF